MGGSVALAVSCQGGDWELAGWRVAPLPGHGADGVAPPAGNVVEDVDTPFAAVAILAHPVSPPPAPAQPSAVRIKAAQTNVVLIQGKSLRVPAAAYKGAKKAGKVTFSSSASKVAKVTKNGKITAKKPGRAVITIKAPKAKAIKITVRVLPKSAPKPKVARVKAAGVPKKMTVGKVAWAAGSYAPAKAPGVKITYRSSAKSVAAVDATGRIVAKAKGKATITVKAGPKVKKHVITIR
jgi:uncharacterized protein YjdB